MRPRLAALAIAILSVISAQPSAPNPVTSVVPSTWPRRATSRRVARVQQAQRGYDDAVARNKDIAANYQGALNEQKTAGRLLADADVSGPRAAEAVKREDANVEPSGRRSRRSRRSSMPPVPSISASSIVRSATCPSTARRAIASLAARAKDGAARQDRIAWLSG
jgi:hypothetical protein